MNGVLRDVGTFSSSQQAEQSVSLAAQGSLCDRWVSYLPEKRGEGSSSLLWVGWVHLWPCTGRGRSVKDFLHLCSRSQTFAKLAPTLLKRFEVLGWNVQSMYGMCYGCMECGGYYSSLLL